MNNRIINCKYDCASYSAIGKRKNNEDSYTVAETGTGILAVVADGVGGYIGGEIASRKLVESMNSYVKTASFSEDALEDAIIDANHDVLSLGRGSDGPLTTLAMLWLNGKEAFAANVGDSRIYQFRDGKIIFQSVDHSVPQLAVQAGEIRTEDIRKHKDRNKITRCIGSERFVSANIEKLSVQAGDRFLLCSDGFWEPVLEQDMIRAARNTATSAQWLDAMRVIAFCNEKDNHTAVSIVVLEDVE